MKTFLKHFQHFPRLVQQILDWNPDYIVPVAKKGGKLLRLTHGGTQLPADRLRYQQYFLLNRPDLRDRKVAVMDDASQYTATLLEYRHFFEKRGAVVRTFSFVGHEGLKEGTHWQYDERAEITVHLPEPVYQEYILQEAYHLLHEGSHFDLDHLVLELLLEPDDLPAFMNSLEALGRVSTTDSYCIPPNTITRFALDDLATFSSLPYLRHPAIDRGPLRKIKFVHDASRHRLSFAPMVFPIWRYRGVALAKQHFQDVPFPLPFGPTGCLDTNDLHELLRCYYSIYLVYAVSLLKAFFQVSPFAHTGMTDLRVRSGDLQATFGQEAADVLTNGIPVFLRGDCRWDFSEPPVVAPRAPRATLKLTDAASLIEHLRTTYDQLVEARQTRVNVHYTLSYDTLFSCYQDVANLSPDLDYYCDLGILVPITERKNGRIGRSIRSGEPCHDLNWRRTSVVVPLAIDQVAAATEKTRDSIEATALVKALASFVFDFPSETHHELHCLVTEPYLFGAFVRAYHKHRGPSRPSLYDAASISPYYRWDKELARFLLVNKEEVPAKLQEYFDERQEVPYTEIVSYFQLLGRVYKQYRSVDILNMLSICREENYFYSHVHFNLEAFFEAFANYRTTKDVSCLERAAAQAGSAETKLRLFEKLPSTLGAIGKRFGAEFGLVKSIERITRNYVVPSERFASTARKLNEIVETEALLAAVCGFVEGTNTSAEAVRRVDRGSRRGWHKVIGVLDPKDACALAAASPELGVFVDQAMGWIEQRLDALERPLPPLASRLRMDAERRARNVATTYVKSMKARRLVLVYLDFSGLRQLPEPKEAILGLFYNLVNRVMSQRNGERLYGGNGGDDAFTFAFLDPIPALLAAREVKADFEADLILRSNGDVKFGVAGVSCNQQLGDAAVVKCWGRAKDCCELKTRTFRNRGHLVIDRETLDWVRLRDPQSGDDFVSLDIEDHDFWCYRRIRPIVGAELNRTGIVGGPIP